MPRVPRGTKGAVSPPDANGGTGPGVSNFAAISWLDTFDLAASLRTRMGLFKMGDEGIFTALVRTTRANDRTLYGYTKTSGVASGKWPEMKIAIDRIKAIGDQGGGIEFGRIALEMLHPRGASGGWAAPDDSPFDLGYLLLRGNPGLVWYSGAETWMPTIGVLTLVNRRVPNSAVNMGESPAIWLSADFRKQETKP